MTDPDILGTITVEQDFNDKLINGDYDIWLRQGMKVIMFDGETIVHGTLDETLFARVTPDD